MTTRAKRSAKSPRIEALVGEDRELLKSLLKESLQEVLEAEMTEAVGAGPGERTADRTGYRSGYYSRGLVTRIGKLELRVPRDREGRFSTEFFDRLCCERAGASKSAISEFSKWCFRHQLLLPRPYLVLTKPLRLDIQCQRGASVKIGWKYLDD